MKCAFFQPKGGIKLRSGKWFLSVITVVLCLVAWILRAAIDFRGDVLLPIQFLLSAFFVILAVYSLRKKKLYVSFIIADIFLLLLFSPLYDAMFDNSFTGLNADTLSVLWAMILNQNIFVCLLLIAGTVLILGFGASKLWKIIKDPVKEGLREMFSEKNDEKTDENTDAQKDSETGQTPPSGPEKNGEEAKKTEPSGAGAGTPPGPRNKQDKSTLWGLLAVVIVVISFVITILILKGNSNDSSLFSIFPNSSGEGDLEPLNSILNALFSFFAILFTVLCAVTALIDFIIWFILRIRKTIQKKDAGNILGLVSVLTVTFLIIKRIIPLPDTWDGATSALANSDLFSSTVYLVILIPTFIFLWNVFVKAVKNGSDEENNGNNDEAFDTKRDIHIAAFYVWEIASGIVLGLLRFLKFVTANFLDALLQELHEEESDEENPPEDQST